MHVHETDNGRSRADSARTPDPEERLVAAILERVPEILRLARRSAALELARLRQWLGGRMFRVLAATWLGLMGTVACVLATAQLVAGLQGAWTALLGPAWAGSLMAALTVAGAGALALNWAMTRRREARRRALERKLEATKNGGLRAARQRPAHAGS